MKQIVLFLLIALTSCQKADIEKSIAGTEWIGVTESSGSYESNIGGKSVKSEYLTETKITLKFTTETSGIETSTSITIRDGISEQPETRTHKFTYDYDRDYKKGFITADYYNEIGEGRLTFEIRSGILYLDGIDFKKL